MLAAWITPQLVVDGAVNGLVIGLVAIGLLLVYRTSKVINFAVGAMGTIGAAVLVLLVLDLGAPFWVGLPLVLVLGTAYGAAVELVVVRRLFDSPRVIVLVATIGVAGLSMALVQLLPAPDLPFAATYPVAVDHVWEDVLGVRATGAQAAIVVVVPAVAGLLAWFLTRTTVGKAVNASADNPRLARTMGINPRWVSTGVWAASGLLATLSMVLVAGQSGSVTGIADLGPNILLRALAAFLLAGMRSFPRALVAGVAIGVAEALVRFNFLTEAGLVDLLLFGVVLVAVWLTARQSPEAVGLHAFAPRDRPVPAALAGRWWVRRLGLLTGAVALAGSLVAALVITSPSRLQLLATITAFAICAASLTLLTGWAGQPSLGQMAFAGIGALVAAAGVRGVEVDLGWGGTTWVQLASEPIPFALAIPLGALAAAGLAALVGAGAVRVRGTLLAVSTFALAVVADQYLYRRPLLSGGGSGSVPFPRGDLLGLDLGSERTYLLVVLGVLAVVLAALARLHRAAFGRAVLAVRDNPDGAAALSVSPTGTTLRTFALAGGIAGLGGALLAGAVETVPFADRFFGVQDSLDLLAMVVIGGLSSLAGAVIGAAWVVGLPAVFPDDPVLPLLASSMGLLVLLLYFPGGLAQLGRSARDAALDALARRLPDRPAVPRAAPSATGLPVRLREAAADAGAAAGDGAVPALAATGISVRFGGILAVDDVSLTLAGEEVVGLIGTNGAGKSTLLDAIGGFVPARGRVVVRGRDVSERRPHQRARAGLGRTFQSARLFPELTVRDSVRVALSSAHRSSLVGSVVGLPGARRAERATAAEADELIDLVGLGRYADVRIDELSTGTRRIVELAGLLGLGARVLCLDEPTAGVAQRETEAFGPLLADLRAELGASMVVVEHDLPFIAGISDRLVCLESGRVIADGDPDAVRRDPRVVASYLGTDARAIERSGATTSRGGQVADVRGAGIEPATDEAG